MSHFRISGRIIACQTHKGISGLRVEAWDKELILDDLVGNAITNAKGNFQMEFDEDYFWKCFIHRRPELFFRIFDQDRLILSTQDSILWNVDCGDTEIVIEVDIPVSPDPDPNPKPERFIVQGQITLADGSHFAGATVHAFDKDLRHEQLLGEKTTDKDGNYKIAYTAEQFCRAEKGTADLIVRVFSADKVVAESPTIFNAQPFEIVDLTVSRDAVGVPSEYEQLLQYLEPLLVDITIAGIPTPSLIDKIADLKPEDIDFLTQETGIERQQLEFLAESARLEKQATKQHFNLPAAVFYGLAREGLPLDLLVLFKHSTMERRNVLEQAIQYNIIPATLKDSLDRILQELEKFVAQYVQQTPPTDGKPSFGDLLNTSVLSSEQQATFLKQYGNHQGPIEDFWKSLSQQPEFQRPEVVENLQFTLQLGLLTQNHVLLIQALQTAHHPASTRDLVRIDIPWTELVNQVGVPSGVPGTTREEKTTNYVNGIVGTLQAAFPTETVAKTVAQTSSLNLPAQQAVSLFFDNSSNPSLNFDLRTTRIDPFIAQYAESVFDGVSESDRPKVIDQVKRIQRLFQVSTSADTVTALLSSKYDSAYAIANTPRATFIEQMRTQLGSEQQAQAVYSKAQRVNTTALHVYTRVHQALNDVQPFVLGTSAQAVQQMLLENSPTLAQLFGSLELCDCKDCRSVLSPAAYFVDLLHTLENSIPNPSSPLVVLLSRRPDLQYIRLNCENTNTLIPYIDLVNEVLESYVVYDQTLPFTVTNPPPPLLPFTINKPNESSDGVTADELAANPENTNARAYDILKEAVYPLSLPYNQPVEVARVYLEHLGSSRYEVMQTFQKPATATAPAVPSDLDIACEYLRISPEEYNILIGASTKNLRDFYGYDAERFKVDKLPAFSFDPKGTTDPNIILYVLVLQHLLNLSGANPVLEETGKFDTTTKAALDTFKQNHGISVNGVNKDVNASTWTALDQVQPIWTVLLPHVPEFLNRTNISYLDLIELVKTHFINPNYQALYPVITFFESLNTNSTDLAIWVHNNFINPSAAIQKAFQDAGISLERWVSQHSEQLQQLQQLIVLYAPSDSQCNLSLTKLQHMDGTNLDATDSDSGPILFDANTGADSNNAIWSKIHRFLRLWRKLGWSMAELDKTLTALKATDITSDVLLKLAQIKRLQTELNVPLIQILSFWADIDTWGDNSLYKKLFLNKAALRLDPVFQPNPDGSVLTNAGGISDHIPAILAALRVSETDLNLIRADANLVDQNAQKVSLTLPYVSILYRYTVLAKALKLKIKDLIGLKTLSEIEPFQAQTPAATVAFVNAAHHVKSSPFSIAQLNYLYRHSWEPGSPLSPQPEAVVLLAQTLRGGLQKIAQDNVLTPDPAGDLTRSKLGSVFEPAIADQVVHTVDGSAVYTAPFKMPSPAIAFPASVKNKIAYEKAASVLKFSGAMTQQEKNDLLNLLPTSADYNAAINQLFQQPRELLTNVLAEILNSSPQGRTPHTVTLNALPTGINFPDSVANHIDYNSTTQILQFKGTMSWAERATLLNASSDPAYQAAINQLFQQTDPTPPLVDISSIGIDGKPVLLDAAGNPVAVSTNAVTTAIAQKFAYILQLLLPYLQDKLSRSLIKQVLSDNLKLDNTVTQALLESILKAYTDAIKPAIADFLALIGDGLSAAYFANPTFTGNAALTRVDPTVDFSWGQNLPDPSITQQTYSVRWIGKLLAPSDEVYTFYLNAAAGTLQLWIDNQLIADRAIKPLKAGQLYDIKVEYARTDATVGAIAQLQWSSPSIPKAIIPQNQLYSGQTFSSFDLPLKSYYLLQKIAVLVNPFKITGDELIYLSAHRDDFAGVDPNDPSKKAPFNLNTLPLDPSEFKPAFFDQWLRLTNLFALRDSLPLAGISLIEIFAFAATNGDKTSLSRNLIQQLLTAVSQDSDYLNLLVTWLPAPLWSSPGLSLDQIKSAIERLLRVDWTGLSEATIHSQITTLQLLVPITDPTQPPSHPSNFINLLARLDGAQILILMLGIATSWGVKEITSLMQEFSLILTDFKDERSLLRLQVCMQLIKRVGISADKLSDWATATIPDPARPNKLQDIARDIKQTVKAKYDDETWLTVAKPLSDKLRESQKEALIAYVLAIPDIIAAGVTTPDQLFEYFLIDVEMSACMMTSRIKQAISSVQLFVDRCLMNLEPEVLSDAIDPDVWQWMKHYRIWEANRKVFLYPENWIEPELRDNKTPFFKELESELLQNDLTNDTAETAFQNYLEKLDEVARLEICGMYWQDNSTDFPVLRLGVTGAYVAELQRKLNTAGANPPLVINRLFDDNTRNAVIAFQQRNKLTINGVVGSETWAVLDSSKIVSILHVFGRTFNTRHVYYYRRLENNIKWTPWEKVQVDIEGDHLIPLVWNRRLHIFWPIFTEKAVQPESTNGDKSNSSKNGVLQSLQDFVDRIQSIATNLDDKGSQVTLRALIIVPIMNAQILGIRTLQDAVNALNLAASANLDDKGSQDIVRATIKVVQDELSNIKSAQSGSTSTNTPPEKYLEIKLAWSEYKNGKWSAKKMLSKGEVLEAHKEDFGGEDILNPALYVFKMKPPIGDDSLEIRCIHRARAKSSKGTDTPQVEVYKIFEPPVTARDTSMQQLVTFRPGDTVSIKAGGCVQTGGSGLTWKRYVNPSGKDSDKFYHGLIALPGMGLTRISDFINQGNRYVIPPNANDMTLHLGYEDDDYHDNGYWGHDDGNDDQCKLENDGGPAWIDITVVRSPVSNDGNDGKVGTVIGAFKFAGCAGVVNILPFVFSDKLLLEPERSIENFMTFQEIEGAGRLTLSTADIAFPDADWSTIKQTARGIETLVQTPSIYRLLYPHQYPQFFLQAPFFYQDDLHAYFVVPQTAEPIIDLPPLPLIFATRGGAITGAGIDPTAKTSGSLDLLATTMISSVANSGLSGITATREFAVTLSAPAGTLAVDWATQERNHLAQWLLPTGWQYPRETEALKFFTHYHPYICRFIEALNRAGIPGLLTVDNQVIWQDTDPQDDSNTVFNSDYFPTSFVLYHYPHENVDFSIEGEGSYSLYNWELFFHTVMLIATRLTQTPTF